MAKHGSEKVKKITIKKAKLILKDGTVRGKKLTKKQKGFFGARAGGLVMPKMMGRTIDEMKKKMGKKSK